MIASAPSYRIVAGKKLPAVAIFRSKNFFFVSIIGCSFSGDTDRSLRHVVILPVLSSYVGKLRSKPRFKYSPERVCIPALRLFPQLTAGHFLHEAPGVFWLLDQVDLAFGSLMLRCSEVHLCAAVLLTLIRHLFMCQNPKYR